jgi:hypothetical protein
MKTLVFGLGESGVAATRAESSQTGSSRRWPAAPRLCAQVLPATLESVHNRVPRKTFDETGRARAQMRER